MGTRGPVPKRQDQRRRRNRPEDGEVGSAPGAVDVQVPEAREGWHPVAVAWFESLALSGQSAFYEPSDWATAVLLAESMSRELLSDGPPAASAVSAWWKGMASLMVTEGDRRRLRLELERPQQVTEEAAGVSELDEYRRRLLGAG